MARHSSAMYVKQRLQLNSPWHWYGLLNFIVLQWFFVRLGRVQIKIKGQRKWKSAGLVWIGGIVPLTGWCDDIRYVGRRGK